MNKIIKYVLHDIFRNRILLAYVVLLSLSSFGLFMMNEDVSKGLSSLLTVLLIVVPLVSILFTTIYFFNSYEFIELLVAQPLKRSNIRGKSSRKTVNNLKMTLKLLISKMLIGKTIDPGIAAIFPNMKPWNISRKTSWT